MKYKLKKNWLGGIIVDENDEPLPLKEITNLLNEQSGEIQEFITVLSPIKELMVENDFDIEELPKLVESGIENETRHYKELLRLTERIIENHLSQSHNENYQAIKTRLLLNDKPNPLLNCRCYIPGGIFNELEDKTNK